MANAALAKLSELGKFGATHFYPFTAVVEPTNICQLKCPICVTGMKIPGRPKGYMKLDTAQKIADQLGPYLMNVELDNWGEPLLHPRMFDLIKIFRQARVMTAMSSNLSLKNFDAEGMIASGLDVLIVSTDAVSEQTYLKYRRGGDFDLVLSNIRKLVAAKKSLKRDNPYLILKFISFPHNAAEAEPFKQMAQSLGADQAKFFEAYYVDFLLPAYLECLTPEQADQVRNRPKMGKMRRCSWPWTSVTFNWDGAVSVCCGRNSHHREYDLGNINDTPIKEIWFGPLYRQIRKVFHGVEPKNLPPRACWHCYNSMPLPPTGV
jgi:MoaA/NifB/PqqE/SkfB family radical SAM enzyme